MPQRRFDWMMRVKKSQPEAQDCFSGGCSVFVSQNALGMEVDVTSSRVYSLSPFTTAGLVR